MADSFWLLQHTSSSDHGSTTIDMVHEDGICFLMVTRYEIFHIYLKIGLERLLKQSLEVLREEDTVQSEFNSITMSEHVEV